MGRLTESGGGVAKGRTIWDGHLALCRARAWRTSSIFSKKMAKKEGMTISEADR